MGFSLRKILASFLFAALLLPAIAFANTEFKGKETVNINKANAATLAAYLRGVGANKAGAIVKYRKANGKFSKIEDLKNVPGIGDETFKDVKKNISTSRGKSVAPEGYKMAETSGKSTPSKKRKTSSSKGKSSTTKSTSKTSTKKSTSKRSSTKKALDDTKSTSKKSTVKKKPTKKKTTKTSKTKKSSTTKSTKKTTKKKPTKKKTTKKKKSKKKSS